MDNLAATYFDIGCMDTLAAGSSPLHRLDARAKLLTTLLFIVAVVSFNKYEVSALAPFFLYPVFLIAAGELPAGYLAKKVLLVSPFAVFVGILNPALDRHTLFNLGPLAVSGGWVSFVSILLRFALTVSAALALVSLTGLNAICEALTRFHVPKPFVIQLLFLNRFLSVLTGEAARMARARSLRARGGAMGLKVFTQLIGHLLLRAVERAERIYLAMLARGFHGHIKVLRFSAFGRREAVFVLGWAAAFTLFRLVNIPLILGNLLTGR